MNPDVWYLPPDGLQGGVWLALSLCNETFSSATKAGATRRLTAHRKQCALCQTGQRLEAD